MKKFRHFKQQNYKKSKNRHSNLLKLNEANDLIEIN